jgi:hypothetical protein
VVVGNFFKQKCGFSTAVVNFQHEPPYIFRPKLSQHHFSASKGKQPKSTIKPGTMKTYTPAQWQIDLIHKNKQIVRFLGKFASGPNEKSITSMKIDLDPNAWATHTPV